jgi:hypothetical protein
LSNQFAFNQLQKIGEHLVSTKLLKSKNIDFQRYKGMVRVPSIPQKPSEILKAFLFPNRIATPDATRQDAALFATKKKCAEHSGKCRISLAHCGRAPAKHNTSYGNSFSFFRRFLYYRFGFGFEWKFILMQSIITMSVTISVIVGRYWCIMAGTFFRQHVHAVLFIFKPHNFTAANQRTQYKEIGIL